MNSLERMTETLNHQERDQVPLDVGGCAATGIHVSSVYLLRQWLGLDTPGTLVKVMEPYQLLGDIKSDLIEALGIDVIGVGSYSMLSTISKPGSQEKAWLISLKRLMNPGNVKI